MTDGSPERVKQVILIRRDLTMRRGKEIAQGSHASMEFLVSALRGQLDGREGQALSLTLTPVETAWLLAGTGKVCLKVESEEQLMSCHEKARDRTLVARSLSRREAAGTS